MLLTRVAVALPVDFPLSGRMVGADLGVQVQCSSLL